MYYENQWVRNAMSPLLGHGPVLYEVTSTKVPVLMAFASKDKCLALDLNADFLTYRLKVRENQTYDFKLADWKRLIFLATQASGTIIVLKLSQNREAMFSTSISYQQAVDFLGRMGIKCA